MTFAEEVEADSPDLWWDTRQAVGTVQPDASGNGFTGTLINGPTLDATNGVLFDGAAQAIVSDVDVIPIGSVDTFAVEAVVTRTGDSYHCAGFAGTLGSDGYLALLIFNVPDFSYNLFNAVDGLEDIPLDVLTHVMGTYDGTDLKVYVDGVEAASTPIASDPAVFAVAQPFRVGDDGDDDEFVGNIMHAIYYGHSVSAERVAAHAAAALGGLTYTPPIAYDMGPVLFDTQGLQRLLFRHYSPHGRFQTVWKLATDPITYSLTQPYPLITPDDVRMGNMPIGQTYNDATYLHVYYGPETVDADEAARLIASGIGTVT